ncbi:hypothetical protein CYMTET_29425 [Cymbomonas tetramitiformis]|uniref:Protein kinase domain-containing protein n=1 Tax=Cymbomonas tetramitiformis TaxID=36881 RepID=A0AAE0KV64_9CHLO|nr:hypothetical protein CYMTET_29425 [Cymbomonas tetramitiformis]
MLFLMLSGSLPFPQENPATAFEAMLKAHLSFREDFWNGISSAAKDLVSKLLVADPEKRLTANEALQHEWIVEQASFVELCQSKERLHKHHAMLLSQNKQELEDAISRQKLCSNLRSRSHEES